MNKKDWKKALLFIVGTELVGLLSSLLSGNISEIYRTLEKPALSPPGWLFGVIWPILFALIGYAAYRVYRNTQRASSLNIYYAQLFFNFIWPILFFRYHLFWAAVVDILVLLCLVVWNFISFYREDKPAGYLLLPYIAWLAFATYLNIGVAQLN